MAGKDDSKINPLRCCQSNSLTSVSTDEDNILCEAKNNYVISPKKNKDLANNNTVFDVVKDESILGLLSGNHKHHMAKDTKKIHHFPKRQEVDLEFNNVTYTAHSWSVTKFRKESKNILHGVSGVFKAGELSVIMGPSGAGKSTLLNILAGFITKGSSAEIKLNDVVRNQSPRFRKLSAYIPQDEELRLGLTAKEAMMFAANFKLGYNVSSDYKHQQVNEILELLGLEMCHNTMTSRLSGGQRKRLAIALELLSNPPILFLDEPTTGLDSSSCTSCVSLLKRLATEGRTVVCTIHQPSALLFEMFDKLYALAEGKCIYDGTTKDLVPHLSSLGLSCPPYHNPADFLMEVAIGEYDRDLDALSDAAKVRKLSAIEDTKENEAEAVYEKKQLFDISNDSPIPAGVIMQFFLLFQRALLQNKRCFIFLLNRILAHVAIGLVFGYLYRGVGSGANTILGNYVYLYGSLLLLVYTGKMSVTLTFPLEMRILTREHFNRWYKLTPYLISTLLIEIPFQIMCTWIYIAISYWLTDQPTDFRVYLFVMFCTLSSLCAQSWGYFIGATTPTKIAVFLGPVIACLFSVFGFCIRQRDTPVFFQWLFDISYYRAGFQGVVYSMYGFDREELFCPEDEFYCHYAEPSKFLKEMDILNVDLVSNVTVIVVIWCVMSVLTYITLWFKLNKR